MNQSTAYKTGCTFWTSNAAAYVTSKPAGQELYCSASQPAGTARCTGDYTSQGTCFVHPLTEGAVVPVAYSTGRCYDPANDQGASGACLRRYLHARFPHVSTNHPTNHTHHTHLTWSRGAMQLAQWDLRSVARAMLAMQHILGPRDKPSVQHASAFAPTHMLNSCACRSARLGRTTFHELALLQLHHRHHHHQWQPGRVHSCARPAVLQELLQRRSAADDDGLWRRRDPDHRLPYWWVACMNGWMDGWMDDVLLALSC
jgi:hypothetical protein